MKYKLNVSKPYLLIIIASVLAIVGLLVYIRGSYTMGSYSLRNGYIKFDHNQIVGSCSSFNGYQEEVNRIKEAANISITVESTSKEGNLYFVILDQDKTELLRVNPGERIESFTLEKETYRFRIVGEDYSGQFKVSYTGIE